MSRDHNSWRRFDGLPSWHRGFYNPPAKYRRRWRREARVRLKRALLRDPDAFQPFPTNRLTSVSDWY